MTCKVWLVFNAQGSATECHHTLCRKAVAHAGAKWFCPWSCVDSLRLSECVCVQGYRWRRGRMNRVTVTLSSHGSDILAAAEGARAKVWIKPRWNLITEQMRTWPACCFTFDIFITVSINFVFFPAVRSFSIMHSAVRQSSKNNQI